MSFHSLEAFRAHCGAVTRPIEQCPICSKIPAHCRRSHVYEGGIGEHDGDNPPEVEQLVVFLDGGARTSILNVLQCPTCRRLYLYEMALVGEDTYVSWDRIDVAALFDHELCMRRRLPDRDVQMVHPDRFFPRHVLVRIGETWAAVDGSNQVAMLDGFHALSRLLDRDKPNVIDDLGLAQRYAIFVEEVQEPRYLRVWDFDRIRWRDPLTTAERQRLDAARAASNDALIVAERLRDSVEIRLWGITRGELVRHQVTVRRNGTTYCHKEVIATQLPTRTSVQQKFTSLEQFRLHCGEPTMTVDQCTICSKILQRTGTDDPECPELARLEHFIGEAVQRCPNCRQLYLYESTHYGNDIYTGNDSSWYIERISADALFDRDWCVRARLPDWKVGYVPSEGQFFPHHVIVKLDPRTWAALDHDNRLVLLDGKDAFAELIARDPPAVTTDLEVAKRYVLFIDECENPDDWRPGFWRFVRCSNTPPTPEEQRQLDDAKEASGLGKGLPSDAAIDMSPVATREGDTVVVRSWTTSRKRLIHRIITVQPDGRYLREDAVIAENLPI